MNHFLEVILFQPQIPQNCGNIVRTCAVTGTKLTLVAPLGFSISDRWLKRAGLDYWEGVEVNVVDNLESYLLEEELPFTFFSSKAKKSYWQATYRPKTRLIFGSETTGLPATLLERFPEASVKIPMLEDQRCLNLATSVGIGLYEAIRQVTSLPNSPAEGDL